MPKRRASISRQSTDDVGVSVLTQSRDDTVGVINKTRQQPTVKCVRPDDETLLSTTHGDDGFHRQLFYF